MGRRESVRAAAVAVVFLLIVTLFAMALVAFGEGWGQDGFPSKASDLFEATKVWTLHLGFTPERWAATEPEGGTNPSDMSAFGLGMSLTPAVMRDGDTDKNGSLSSAEFRWSCAAQRITFLSSCARRSDDTDASAGVASGPGGRHRLSCRCTLGS